jgi:hypothetical protein
MRILEGVGTLIQLGGLIARLCKMVSFWFSLSRRYCMLTDLIGEYATRAFPDMKFLRRRVAAEPHLYHHRAVTISFCLS